jgi:hypothetical protein
VHTNETANLELLVVAEVVDELSLTDGSAINTDVSELSIAAILELERETDK